jgi:hypothetical protein
MLYPFGPTLRGGMKEIPETEETDGAFEIDQAEQEADEIEQEASEIK